MMINILHGYIPIISNLLFVVICPFIIIIGMLIYLTHRRDLKYRKRMYSLLKKYIPNKAVYELKFGKCPTCGEDILKDIK